MAKQELLSTYLNDHHAGASGAIDLANKAASNNEGTPLGSFLSELVKAPASAAGPRTSSRVSKNSIGPWRRAPSPSDVK